MQIHRAYLAFTIIGIALPIALLMKGMASVDWSFPQAFADLDIFLKSIFGQIVIVWLFSTGMALTIWVIHEAQVRQDYYLLWAILVLIIFSIGAALPFYLYLRTPKRDE